MRQTSRATYIALVTPYGFTRAERLAEELEALGYETTIIDQPRRADRALEADACVIFLTPDGWRDPAIVEVIRNRPASMIPVLAAPMDLPRARWSSEPIPMRGAARDIAGMIADAVDDALSGPAISGTRSGPGMYDDRRSGTSARSLPPNSRPRDPYGNERSMSRSRPNLADPPLGLNGGFGAPTSRGAVAPAKKSGGSPGRTIGILVVVFALLGGLGYAGYHYRYKFFPQKASGPTQMGAYTAAVPGPSCDKGNAQWALPQDHSYFTTACQADGLLVTQASKFGTNASLVQFAGTGPTFPLNYHAQVTATITGGDPHTLVGLIVHGQIPTGGDVFYASSDSSWEFQVVQNSGSEAALRRGFLAAPTKTFTLAVDVADHLMTFSVNGKQVTQVYEGTFGASANIGLLLSTGNFATKTALAAKFSQFQFTPQPTPAFSDSDALSTATAANKAIANPYTTSLPGPACDKGAAQWAAPAFYGEVNATLACTTGGLVMKSKAANLESAVGFYGVKGVLASSNYTIATTMSVTAGDPLACGGVKTRVTGASYYQFVICGDDSYIVNELDAATKQHNKLDGGTLTGGGTYVISVTMKGSAITFKVNGTVISTLTNKDLTTTDHIELFTDGNQNEATTVTFKSFSFTSL